MKWQTASITGQKGYTFTYDSINRLRNAISAEYVGTWTNYDKYSEKNIGYDLNGNILCLQRGGWLASNQFGIMDNLSYYYKGNQLIGVNDANTVPNNGDFVDNGFTDIPSGTNTNTWEYTYDGNGNFTRDVNKGIVNVQYNALNLPRLIDFGNNNRIEYGYNMSGTKLKKQVYNSGVNKGTTDYINGFVYENNIPSYMLFDEGHILLANGTGTPEYHLKDHLGNVRVAFGADGTVKQVNSYYPFGMNIYGLTSTETISTKNKYLYNGKEMQGDFGLNLLDYGARFYDPVIGRWQSVDPLAEVNRRWSPYRYAYDNPIRYIDPDGMVEGDFLDEKGKYLGNDGIDDGKIYVVKTTEKEFDSGASSAGISKDQQKATTSFIESNSGNTEAFKNNSVAYDNSVEIEGSASTRQSMVDVANNDKGSEPSNLHEYGAAISKDGTVGPTETGPIIDPKNQKYAEVGISTDGNTKSIMHTHPSYTKEEGRSPAGTIQMSGTISITQYGQAPSDRDITNAGSSTNYVFGMRSQTVYIYNSYGVQATIPLKRFVNPKK